MKIQNLNASRETLPDSSVQAVSSPRTGETSSACLQSIDAPSVDRQSVEIALLRARIQHLELVIETARSLMGSNQDRLLRRLYEMPRELVALTSQLQRIDAQATW